MTTKDDLKKLQENIASLNESCKKLSLKFKSKANGGEMESEPSEEDEKMSEMTDLMYRIAENLYSYIYRVQDSMWEYQATHAEGHLPKIIGADKMNKVLKKLELDGDYTCEPKTIRASKGNYIIEAEMPE